MTRPLIGVAVLLAVVMAADPAAVVRALANAELALVAGAVAGLALVHLVAAAGWRAILARLAGTWLPWRETVLVAYAAQALGGITPANIGADVHRAAVLRRGGHGWAAAVAPLLVQRATSYLALSVLAVIGSAQLAARTSVAAGIVAAGSVVAVAIGAAAWLMLAPPARLRGVHERLVRLVGIRPGPRTLGGIGPASLVGIGSGLLFHAISIGLTGVLVLAVDPTVPLVPAMAAIAVARLAIAVPVTPSGIGVQEGILAILFIGMGLSADVALAAMLLARLGMGVVTVAGVAALQLERGLAARPAVQPGR